MFDTLGFSCELCVMKPEAQAYLEMCRRLRVEPQNCAYVGDGGSNELMGALEAGMTAILLRHAREIQLEGLPDGARDWSGATTESLRGVWAERDG